MRDHEHATPALARDLKLLTERRQILGWLAALGIAPMLGCTKSVLGGSLDAAAADGGVNDAATSGGECTSVPEETAGPYPGDGSNGANALSLGGIVRSDITSSIGTATGKAAGAPLTLRLELVDAKSRCAVLSGYAVYIWHCDQGGNYSMYAGNALNQNYLRGVQVTDDTGSVTFKSIFPGCYSGRWPHIHFEIYPSLSHATNGANVVTTSQLAMPKAACSEAYTSAGYSSSVANLANVSLATDMVFSDGATLETPTITGNAAAGFLATLTVAVG